jgi:hypothetical protein
LLDFLFGVDGGLEEYGTWKAIVSSLLLRAVSEGNGCAMEKQLRFKMAAYW